MIIDRCYTDDELDEMIEEYKNDEKAQESDRQCDECEFGFSLNEQQKRYFGAMLDIEDEFYKTLSEEQRKDFRELHRHPLISPNGYCGESTEKFSTPPKSMSKSMSKAIYGLNVKVAPVSERGNWCRFIVVEHGTASNRPKELDFTDFYEVDVRLESSKLQRLRCDRLKYDEQFYGDVTEKDVVVSMLNHGVELRDINEIVFYMRQQGWIIRGGWSMRRGGKYGKAV